MLRITILESFKQTSIAFSFNCICLNLFNKELIQSFILKISLQQKENKIKQLQLRYGQNKQIILQ